MSSCPDWTALALRRDHDAAGEAAWGEALAHLDGLDGGCRRCAEAAHAADPTLMFRRLPGAGAGAADVAAMREAVATLRRAGRVAAPEPASGALARRAGLSLSGLSLPRRSLPGGSRLGGSQLGGRGRRSLASGWRHLAAASVLAAAAAGLWLGVSDDLPLADPAVVMLPAGASADLAALRGAAPAPRRSLPASASFAVPNRAGFPGGALGGALDLDAPLLPVRAAEPSVVELSQPHAADVYELGEGDLTLVMVVDETLDV